MKPMFRDRHKKIDGLTAEAVAGAHRKDLEIHGKHGVNRFKYWLNEAEGTVFGLVEAPGIEAAIPVHREAHGMVTDEEVGVGQGK